MRTCWYKQMTETTTYAVLIVNSIGCEHDKWLIYSLHKVPVQVLVRYFRYFGYLKGLKLSEATRNVAIVLLSVLSIYDNTAKFVGFYENSSLLSGNYGGKCILILF